MALANKELNETILRPRFSFEIDQPNEIALSSFEDSKKSQSKFIVSRTGNHVFIRVPKARQQITSPQLHLEIIPINEHKSTVKGLFGPSPTVWTLFMFLHFIIIVLILAICIWAYTNWRLESPLSLQIVLLTILCFIWTTLYFLGKSNKKKRIPEMLEQHHFMRDVLRSNN